MNDNPHGLPSHLLNDPDLQKIFALIEDRREVLLNLLPYDLYMLVAAVQQMTRDPYTSGQTHAYFTHLGRQLQSMFETIQSDIVPVIETGWNTALDSDPRTGRPAKDHLYQVWAIYMDGLEAGDTPMAEYKRPQDWGDPRWQYAVYTLETADYRNIVHCWVDVKMEAHEHLKLFSSLISTILLPGSDPRLCGKTLLHPDDFWETDWGMQPPLLEDDDNSLTVEAFAELFKNGVEQALEWSEQIRGAVIDDDMDDYETDVEEMDGDGDDDL